MDAKTYLIDYARRADEFLDVFFDKKEKEVGEIGRGGKGVLMALDMLKRYKKFGRGGKKIRGALIQLGFEIGGGNKKAVLPASTSIEVIHSFLLMHDDIEDMDSIRRGNPTMHKQFEERHKKFGGKSDSFHYGVSMGINLGDLGAYLGTEILLASAIPDERKVKAGIYLSHLLQRVAYGQGLDVTYEQMKGITEHDVMQVHKHKTGIYTIPGPLKIGALLAGASDKIIGNIEKFGEPIGIAFQLRDDELGLFSNEDTLGKPIGGDIKEGKNTLLRIKAIDFAEAEDKKFLLWAYGNSNISKKDVKKVQDITVRTGALEYSQKLSRKLVKDGKRYITGITVNKNLQALLDGFADLMITRTS